MLGSVRRRWERLADDRSGATFLEYAVLALGCVLAIGAAVDGVGGAMVGIYDRVDTAISSSPTSSQTVTATTGSSSGRSSTATTAASSGGVASASSGTAASGSGGGRNNGQHGRGWPGLGGGIGPHFGLDQ
jgi:Flp pilus assembly pilin Flp